MWLSPVEENRHIFRRLKTGVKMQEDGFVHEDDLIDEALGENPRASEFRLLRVALEERRDALVKELAGVTVAEERVRFEKRLKTLNQQIEALRQEEGVSQFVETSVRVAVSRGPSTRDEEEDEE